jgi:hypothetical protein
MAIMQGMPWRAFETMGRDHPGLSMQATIFQVIMTLMVIKVLHQKYLR